MIAVIRRSHHEPTRLVGWAIENSWEDMVARVATIAQHDVAFRRLAEEMSKGVPPNLMRHTQWSFEDFTVLADRERR